MTKSTPIGSDHGQTSIQQARRRWRDVHRDVAQAGRGSRQTARQGWRGPAQGCGGGRPVARRPRPRDDRATDGVDPGRSRQAGRPVERAVRRSGGPCRGTRRAADDERQERHGRRQEDRGSQEDHGGQEEPGEEGDGQEDHGQEDHGQEDRGQEDRRPKKTAAKKTTGQEDRRAKKTTAKKTTAKKASAASAS